MSWALEAIEREAMARAYRAVPIVDTFMGLRAEQIAALKHRFYSEHGHDPAKLDAQLILNMGRKPT